VQEHDTSERTAQEALIRALARTADARRGHGRYADAERLYERALALADEVLGAPHPELVAILTGLAAVKEAQGDLRQAELLHGRASAMREALLDDDRFRMAT
jgi:hypothetical protein